MDTVKRKVGRPGRKKIDVQSQNKRTQQNRAAQRAYRERKEAKLKSLENRISILEKLNTQREQESVFLQAQLCNWRKGSPPTDTGHIDKFLSHSKQIKEQLIKDYLHEGEHLDELMTTLSSGPSGIHHISKIGTDSTQVDNQSDKFKDDTTVTATITNSNTPNSPNDHCNIDSNTNKLQDKKDNNNKDSISLFLQTPKNGISLNNTLPVNTDSPISFDKNIFQDNKATIITAATTATATEPTTNNHTDHSNKHADSCNNYDSDSNFWSQYGSNINNIDSSNMENSYSNSNNNPFTNNWDNTILNNYIIDENDIEILDPSLFTISQDNTTNTSSDNTKSSNNLAFPDIWNDNLLDYLQLTTDLNANNNRNKKLKPPKRNKIKCDLLTEHVINKKSLQSLMQDREFIDSHSHTHSSSNNNTTSGQNNNNHEDNDENSDTNSTCSSCDSCCCGDLITEFTKNSTDPLEVAMKNLCDKLLLGSEVDNTKNFVLVDPSVISSNMC